MKYCFDADSPTRKMVQYYEMMGTRALWHDGWHVVAQRAPQQGGTAADLINDTWELYHSEEDRSEVHDLADQYPDKVRELVNLWYVEAGKYDVLPLDNRSLEDLVKEMPVADIPEGGIYRYYPQTSPVPEFAAAEIRGRSFKILAQVDLTDADAEGVIIANGARFGGHSLFIKDRKLWYVNNFLGIPPEQQLVSPDELSVGSHVLGVEFAKEATASTARRWDGHPLRRRPRGRQERVEDPARTLRALWRGPDRRPGQLRPRLEGVRLAVRLHRWAHPCRRHQHRRRRIPRPRARLPRGAWRGTDLTAS